MCMIKTVHHLGKADYFCIESTPSRQTFRTITNIFPIDTPPLLPPSPSSLFCTSPGDSSWPFRSSQFIRFKRSLMSSCMRCRFLLSSFFPPSLSSFFPPSRVSTILKKHCQAQVNWVMFQAFHLTDKKYWYLLLLLPSSRLPQSPPRASQKPWRLLMKPPLGEESLKGHKKLATWLSAAKSRKQNPKTFNQGPTRFVWCIFSLDSF